MDSAWLDISFTPAPNGWKIVFVDPDGADAILVVPMPGWLTQELGASGLRRVIAGAVDRDGSIIAVVEAENFYIVFGPDEDLPSSDEIRDFQRHRKTAEHQSKLRPAPIQ